MTRVEALQSVISSLRDEISALKAFDVDALVAATESKEHSIGRLQGTERHEVTPEIKALAQEAASLNEQARVFVNLMSANVRRQLDQLTGVAPAATYGRGGLRVVA